jgi:hypothetical protein
VITCPAAKSKHLAKPPHHPGSAAAASMLPYQTLPSLDPGGQHFPRGTGLNVPLCCRENDALLCGPRSLKLPTGHLLNRAKSTLAMFPETNLVWTIWRAVGGIRNALLQVRS